MSIGPQPIGGGQTTTDQEDIQNQDISDLQDAIGDCTGEDVAIPTSYVGTSGTAVSGSNKLVDNADNRIPSQDENNALVGTSGTAVSSSNKLVDNADTRLLDAYERAATLTANVTGTPSGSNPFIVESNPAVPLIYTDLTAAEAGTGIADGRLCWVQSLGSHYKKVDSGSAYTRDATFVLNTGDGGATRWVAVDGTYQYENKSSLRIADDDDGVEWSATKSRGDGVAGKNGEVLLNIPIFGYNDAGTPEKIEFATLKAIIADASDGAEGGKFLFQTLIGGAFNDTLALYGGKCYVSRFSQVSATSNFLYTTTFYPTGSGTNAILLSGNASGAHEPLLYIYGNNGSGTGAMAKIRNDGTGDLIQAYQSTNLKFSVDTDGNEEIAGGLGINGQSAPPQSTYSTDTGDLAACLIAHGFMAAA